MFATCALDVGAWRWPTKTRNGCPTTAIFGSVGFCAVFLTAFTYSISNASQNYLSAEKVAIIYLFEPVFAALAAFFILGESLGGRLLLGGSLVVVAAALSEIDFKRRSRREKASFEN